MSDGRNLMLGCSALSRKDGSHESSSGDRRSSGIISALNEHKKDKQKLNLNPQPF